MSWLTDCEPVKMTEASALQIQMCDLLKGTIQIAKRDLKKTTWSVMPPAVLAALLTCCCAEGCNSIERVGRGTDGGRSFSMCTHLQHSDNITYMFFFLCILPLPKCFLTCCSIFSRAFVQIWPFTGRYSESFLTLFVQVFVSWLFLRAWVKWLVFWYMISQIFCVSKCQIWK